MADSLKGQQLDFPVSYDLRIIYVIAEGAGARADMELILAGQGVAWTMMQSDAKPGATYGRLGVRLTLQSREQMYALYEDIGKLPYVKTAI